ncbi:MAG TPA: ATP-binding protein, partial [Terriglobales bacterium]|nr:ATP-binding protein [Terriglobales bacterium]
SRQSLTADAVELYASSTAQAYEASGKAAADQSLQHLQQNFGIRAALLSENMQILAGTLYTIDQPLVANANSTRQTQIDLRGNFAEVAATARAPSGKKYVLIAELPRRTSGLFRGSASQQLLRWAIAILISGAVCYPLTLYLIRPVLRIRSAASSIAGGDFSARAAPNLAQRRDELGDLVRGFNQMAERIERLMETQQQLLRDISHELRSPLARLTVALEIARKWAGKEATDALNRIEQESERLNEMIGRLLTLARINSLVDPPQHSAVSLRPLLDQIAQGANFEASAKNCSVEVTGGKDCEIQGSPELLHSAIENVIRNAVRHTPPGSTVRARLNCDGTHSRVSISDEGPGVPAAELEKIFRPFYRLSDAREHRSGGTGIGLAITQQVARLHGGAVSAHNASPHGLVVEFELPCRTGKQAASIS